MREILFECIALGVYVTLGYVLSWYCGRFAKARFEAHRGGKYAIVPAWVLLRELMSNLWNTEYQPVMTIVKQLCLAVMLYLLIWCFYQNYWQMRLYLCATFIAISDVSLFLVLELTPLQSYVFQYCTDMFDAGRWSYEAAMTYIESAAVVMQFCTNVLQVALFGVLIRIVADQFRYKRARLDTRDMLYLLSPALMGWILGLLLRSTLYTLEDGVPHLLYDRYPVLHAFVPLMWITILGGIVLTILFYQDMTARREKEFGMRMLEQQVDGLQEQLREVERVNAADRALRHDMQNVLSVAMQLCLNGADGSIGSNHANDLTCPKGSHGSIVPEGPDRPNGLAGENGKLRQYLADIAYSIRETDFKFRTGDSAVDSLLNMKYYAAAEKIPGIRFDAEFFLLPREMKIRSFDLCLILGNALDNAIEACERLYQVSVSEAALKSDYFIFAATKIREETLLVEVKNSFTGELYMETGGEYPDSLKEDAAKHGLGMRNMKRVAQKYFGEVIFHSAEGIFTLWITLQNRPPCT
ncbi:MAG: sensor histidine kinase [Lachnospiraceae bacterium]|nr:sensor histidine kinase [Lachnospiraceae bacterium]